MVNQLLTRSIFFFALFILSCQGSQSQNHKEAGIDLGSESSLKLGLENTFAYFPMLKDKRVALVANHTSAMKGIHLVDTLLKEGFNIVKVFAPEHGFRGTADAGEKVEDDIDESTGIPIISLYGKHKKPKPESLSDVDIVLFDIQDVGVRFYTYISTLHYVMEACAESNKPLIVLDRPNPHAHYVDGPIMEDEFKSFVGMHNVPIVYGLTIGEYAQMINGEKWLSNDVHCELIVIHNLNYNRYQLFEIPIKPSPNLPNALSVQLYPSLCFFEGTSVTAGRGTDLPFQCYGHVEMNTHYIFTPQTNNGSKFPKFKDIQISGVDLSSVDLDDLFNQKSLRLSYLLDAYSRINNDPEVFFLSNNFFEKLAGTSDLRKQLIEGKSEEEIRMSWKNGLLNYLEIRKKYLLY